MIIPSNEYPSYANTYMNLANQQDLSHEINSSQLAFYQNISIDKLAYRYQEGKWSIAEVFGHIIDTERIFSYRALRIGRGDHTPLAGFEQDDYIKNARSDGRSWNSLLEEYRAVRLSTKILYNSFNESDLKRIGVASDHQISARAIFSIIIGHELHHISVIKNRYLI